MLQENEGISGDLRQRMGLIEGTGILGGGHEDGVGGEAGRGLKAALGRSGGKGDVHLARLQKSKHLVAAAGDNADMDGGIEAVELLQIGQQKLAGNGVRCADGEVSHLQLTGLAQLILACFQQANGAADILIQQLTIGSEGHAAAVAGEEPRLQVALQLLDRLAHGRLTNIQRLGRSGDVPRLGNLLKHLIKLQFDRHSSTLLP